MRERELHALRRRVRELERWFRTHDQHIRHLERERQKFSALVNHTDAGFLLIDAEHNIVWVNGVFTERFAIAGAEGRSDRDLCRALCNAENPCGRCPIDRVMATGQVARHEFHRDCAGRRQYLYATVIPVKTPAGTVSETMTMVQDITDLRRSQEEILASKEAAEAANRAKGEFLARMSHEIRTPLNGILAITELLLEMGLNDQQLEAARIVMGAGQSLLGVINDILDFSKIEAGKLDIEAVDFDLRTTVEDSVSLIVAKAREKGLTLLLEFAPGTPRRAVGDPARIRQILLNLIGNAIKFTERGRILVRIASRPAGESHDLYRIEVEDTGVGIAAECLESIFQEFTQAESSTTRRYGGTGLGLTICRQLAELMGGVLEVASEPGRGSTFRAELPLGISRGLGDVAAAHADPAEGETARPWRDDIRILLVEDNPVNQQVMRLLFRRLNVPVEIADCGQAALDMFAASEFDLILMDCMMPGMDGFEATRAIRSLERNRGRRVPIIALTARSLAGDREQCLDSGMDDYLSKPISIKKLVQVLTRYLRDPQTARLG